MEEKLWLYEDREYESRFMEAFKTHPGNLFSLTHKILSDSSLDSDFIWLLFNHKFNTKFRIEDEKGNLTDKPNIELEDKDVIENRRKMEDIFRNIGIAEQFNFPFDFKKYMAWCFPHVLPIQRFNLYLFSANFNK
jgi:hypothetical protein